MSAANQSTRQRRARVLCIGLENSREMLQNCLAQPPILVHNMFEAMGELTTAPATEPIHSALLAASALHDSGSAAVEAMQQIDPSVRIVLVRDTADLQHLSDRSDLFAEVINSPLTATALACALDNGEAMTRVGALDASASTQAPQQRPSTPAPPPTPPAAPSKPNPEPTPVAESPAPKPQSPSTQTAPSRVPMVELYALSDADRKRAGDDTEALGDVDLVESIINNTGKLRELALKLIAQQTGWSDVVLHPAEQFVEGASSAVNFEKQSFGVLTSQATDARSLKPWADWLARWLALDDTHRTHRLMAYRDDLTGAWNRRFFHEFLTDALKRARQLRLPVTVMAFDIDDFKIYNDRYSHEAGDEILIETVRLLESVIRKSDRVCRIGGDEFAVIFADLEGPRAAGSSHPDAVGEIASRFQKQICSMRFPKLAQDAPGTLTISAGLSTFPWDGDDPDELLRLADERAIRSKRCGKNVITFGPEQ